jgi:hypothetical protein
MDHISEVLSTNEVDQVPPEISEKIDRNLAKRETEAQDLQSQLSAKDQSICDLNQTTENLKAELDTANEQIDNFGQAHMSGKLLSQAGSQENLAMSMDDSIHLNVTSTGDESNQVQNKNGAALADYFKSRDLEVELCKLKMDFEQKEAHWSLRNEMQNTTLKRKDNEIETLKVHYNMIRDTESENSRNHGMTIKEMGSLRSKEKQAVFALQKLESEIECLRIQKKSSDDLLIEKSTSWTNEKQKFYEKECQLQNRISEMNNVMTEKNDNIRVFEEQINNLEKSVNQDATRKLEQEKQFSANLLMKQKEIDASLKLVDVFRLDNGDKIAEIKRLTEFGKQLETAGDTTSSELARLKVKINTLDKEKLNLLEENSEFKDQLEMANKLLGESEQKAVDINLLENIDDLAPTAVRVAKIVKGKTLTEILSELATLVEQVDDLEATKSTLEDNLNRLTEQARRIQPHCKSQSKKIDHLEQENAELVAQLDFSRRDQIRFRTEADDLLTENAKLKRQVSRRDKEVANFTDQISVMMSQNQMRSNENSMHEHGVPVQMGERQEFQSEFGVGDVQKILTKNTKLQRRVDEYKEQVKEILAQAENQNMNLELEKKIGEQESRLNVIVQERDGFKNEVKNLKVQLTMYSEVISGKPGEKYEEALSFRDRVLDYKKKYEEKVEDLKLFKQNSEADKRELRKLFEEQRRECLEKSTKADSAVSRVNLIETQCEILVRNEDKLRRTIDQLRVRKISAENEQKILRDKFATAQTELHRADDRNLQLEISCKQRDSTIDTLKSSEARAVAEASAAAASHSSFEKCFEKINEMNNRDELKKESDIQHLKNEVSNLTQTRDKLTNDMVLAREEAEEKIKNHLARIDKLQTEVFELKSGRQAWEKEMNETHQREMKETFLRYAPGLTPRSREPEVDEEEVMGDVDMENMPESDQIDKFKMENAKLKNSIQKKNSKVDQLEKTNNEIKMVSTTAERRYDETMQNMNKMRETYQIETEKLKIEISDTVQLNESLANENSILKKSLETTDAKTEAQVEEYKRTNENLNTELKESRIQINDFQTVLEGQKRELSIRTHELSTIEESSKQLNLDYQEIVGKNHELSAENMSISLDKKAIFDKNMHLELEAQKFHEKLQGEKDAHESERKTWEEINSDLKEQNNMLHKKVGSTLAQLDHKGKHDQTSDSMDETSENTLDLEKANDGTLYRVITTMRKEKEKIQMHAANVETSERSFKNQVIKMEANVRKMKQNLSERDQQLNKIIGMVGSAEQAQSLISQNKQLQDSDKTKTKQIQDLKLSNDNITTKYVNHNKTLQQVQVDLATMRVMHDSQVSSKDDEIQKLKERVASKEAAQNNKKTEAIKQLEEDKIKSDKSAQEWKDKFDKVRIVAKKHRDENVQSKKQLAELQDVSTKHEEISGKISELEKSVKLKEVQVKKLETELAQVKSELEGERELNGSEDNEQTKKIQALLVKEEKKVVLMQRRLAQEKTKVEALTNERDHQTVLLEQRETELNDLMQEDGKDSSKETAELKKKVDALEAEKKSTKTTFMNRLRTAVAKGKVDKETIQKYKQKYGEIETDVEKKVGEVKPTMQVKKEKEVNAVQPMARDPVPVPVQQVQPVQAVQPVQSQSLSSESVQPVQPVQPIQSVSETPPAPVITGSKRQRESSTEMNSQTSTPNPVQPRKKIIRVAPQKAKLRSERESGEITDESAPVENIQMDDDAFEAVKSVLETVNQNIAVVPPMQSQNEVQVEQVRVASPVHLEQEHVEQELVEPEHVDQVHIEQEHVEQEQIEQVNVEQEHIEEEQVDQSTINDDAENQDAHLQIDILAENQDDDEQIPTSELLNADNVPYFRRDSEVSSTECQTVYVRQKSNEDLQEPESTNVIVEDSLTKVTALDEDETVAVVDDDMLDDVEMHDEIVEHVHIEEEIVEDDGLLGEEELVLETVENVIDVNVTEEHIIDEPKEEDDSKDEMDDMNALRNKLIADAAAKRAKKNISKSTDDDEEQSVDSMSKSIARARRGSAEDGIKDLAAALLMPQSSNTTSMPPPKTTPITTDRPATDGAAANRMLQAALGVNPRKKRVLIRKRGQTPDRKETSEEPQ